MSKKNIFGKLPGTLQTTVQKKFFDATVEQLFSKKETEKLNGYVGRRVGGNYDPVNDYYVSQDTKERTWDSLEPMVLSVDPISGETKNEVFLQELLNRIKFLGGKVDNQDKLFKSELYSFSPPIDMDKFVNYSAYYWKTDFGYDHENELYSAVVLKNLSSTDIDDTIIGASEYTYNGGTAITMTSTSAPNIFKCAFTEEEPDKIKITIDGDICDPDLYSYHLDGFNDELIVTFLSPVSGEVILNYGVFDFSFSNGCLCVFPDADDYYSFDDHKANIYQVCGVGSSTGIYLQQRFPNGEPYAVSNADYTTIEFGALNQNDWSVNNFWFHRDVLVEMTEITGIDFFEGSKQAKRPIISFDHELELFGHGTNRRREVDLAFYENNYYTFNLKDASDERIVDKINKTMVFVGGPVDITQNTKQTFVARQTPYNFSLQTPFSSDKDDVFAIVKRPICIDFVEYMDIVSGTPTSGTSFSQSFNTSHGNQNVNSIFHGVSKPSNAITYTFTVMYDGEIVTSLDDQLVVQEIYDGDVRIHSANYTYSKPIKGVITVTFDVQVSAAVTAKIGVKAGDTVIVNPEWYEHNSDTNTLSFTVESFSNPDEVHGLASTPNPLVFNCALSTITEPTYIRIYDNGNLLQNDSYNWVQTSPTNIKITFVSSVTGPLTAIVSDGVRGLQDGHDLDERLRDVVLVYVASQPQIFSEQTNTDTVITVSTDITNISADDVVSIRIKDINGENNINNDVLIKSITYSLNNVIVELLDVTNATTDMVEVIVRDTITRTFSTTDFVWKVVQHDVINDELGLSKGYESGTYVIPFRNIDEAIVDGDIVDVVSGDYAGRTFYSRNNTWNKELSDAGEPNSRYDSNVPPKFQLYFSLFEDKPLTLAEYGAMGFFGSEIFSYKINENSGIIDSEIDIPLEYKNIPTTQGIVFEHDLAITRYFRNENGVDVEIPGYYFFKKINNDGDVAYKNTWMPSQAESKQRVIDNYVFTADTYTLTENEFIQNIKELHLELSVPPLEIDGYYDVMVAHQGTQLTKGRKIQNTDVLEDVVWDFYYESSNNSVVFYVKSVDDVKENDVFEVKTYSVESVSEEMFGFYEQPPQLENNAKCEELYYASAGDLSKHFVSIIANQRGIIGDAFSGNNNYRNTEKDVSLGDVILQTSAPLIKAMISVSSRDIDVVEALRFSSVEYVRYKDKLVTTAKQLIREGWQPSVDLFSSNRITRKEQFFDEVISRITNTNAYNNAFKYDCALPWGKNFILESIINDGESYTVKADVDLLADNTMVLVYGGGKLLMAGVDYVIETSTDMLITGYISSNNSDFVDIKIYKNIDSAFVPSTPAFCGMLQNHYPEIVLDDTYVIPTWVIVGHDGARTPTYTSPTEIDMYKNGVDCLDLRDEIVLEFERRIYNNISNEYRLTYDSLINKYQIIPGFYRTTIFDKNIVDGQFVTDFYKWSIRNGVNYSNNDTCDLLEWKTWNYSGENPEWPGNWKGIYTYLYDTTAPNTAPWEMLGFTQMPTWWIDEYSFGSGVGATIASPRYSSDDVVMWVDLADGYIRDGYRKGYDLNFKRPHLYSSPNVFSLPVDINGDIKAPHLLGAHFGIVEPNDITKNEKWNFGDFGPVEMSWRNTSSYQFSISEKMFLQQPNRYCEIFWERKAVKELDIASDYVVNKDSLLRGNNSKLTVHGEIIDDDVIVRTGYQRFVANYMLFNTKDVTTFFGDIIRNSDVRLSHKVGGFVNKANIKAMLDGVSYASKNTRLIIPEESYFVKTYTSGVIDSYVYSGIMVRIESDGFRVIGYDYTKPEFKYFKRNSIGVAKQISVGGKPSAFRTFKADSVYSIGSIVKYNDSFYQSLENQTVVEFKDGKWKRLRELPSVGGYSLSYIKEYDNTVEYTVPYNTVFETSQELFEFIIGYGDWLADKGWNFTNVDNSVGKIQNWLEAAKDMFLWASNNWGVGNTLQISAGSSKINLTVKRGYPDKVNNVTDGIYSVMDASGLPIKSADLVVDRNDQDISVSHINQFYGVYFCKINAIETEHVIIFDNLTDFNDVIYDPVLNARTNRIFLRGNRSINWFGKYEADGYIIDGDKVLTNFDTLADSLRYFYDSNVELDNTNVDNVAKHLIGFENSEYLETFNMFGDTQHLLYKGMLPEKGTITPIEKIMRAKDLLPSGDLQIYENWAFKMGDFGDVSNKRSLELRINGDEVTSDPQLIELVYPSKQDNELGEAKKIVLTNAEHVYNGKPFAMLWDGNYEANPSNLDKLRYKTFIDASTEVVLDGNKRVSHVKVLSSGTTEISKIPSVVFYDIPNTDQVLFHSEIHMVIDKNHEPVNDSAICVIGNKISEIAENSNNIVIDIDDSEKWLSNNPVSKKEDLFPLTDQIDSTRIIKNAGYVHYDDIDCTVYDISNLVSTLKNIGVNSEKKYVWVAETHGNKNKDWDVFKVCETTIDNSDVAGIIVVDGEFYVYTPADASLVSEIQFLTDGNGTVIENAYAIVPDASNGVENIGEYQVTGNSSKSGKKVYLSSDDDNDPQLFISRNATEYGINGQRVRVTVSVSKTLPESDVKIDPSLYIVVEQTYSNQSGNVETSSSTPTMISDGSNAYVFDLDIKEYTTHVTFGIAASLEKEEVAAFVIEQFSIEKIMLVKTLPNGETISEIIPPEIDLQTTNNMFLKSCRFKVKADIDTTFFTDVLKKAWVDGEFVNGKFVNDWAVYVDDLNTPLREKEAMMNSFLFETATMFDEESGLSLIQMPVYDPYKGIIPVMADRNLTYISDVDPSRYTVAAEPQYVNDTLSFSKKEVGRLWWDTSSAKYVCYEQGSNEYRKNNWGTLFPGSIVSVYEWVESGVPPEEYTGTGTPKNLTDYVVRDEFEQSHSKYVTKYYFWVKDVEVKPSFLHQRNMSAKNVARLIANPRNQGYAWYAAVSMDAIVFNNCNYSLVENKNIMQIGFKYQESDSTAHSEWKIIGDGNPDDSIPDMLYNKLIDSLTKIDSNGNIVPNPKLSDYNKLGVKSTPIQTMITDVYDARKVMSQSLNSLLKTIPIRDEQDWINNDPLGESAYWGWVDWYADGYDSSNTIPKLVINHTVSENRDIPPPPNLSSEQKKILNDGDIVQVYAPNNSSFYVYNATEEVATILVKREKTALELNDSIYERRCLLTLDSEIRHLLYTVKDLVFAQLSTADYSVKNNEFFFSMVKYISSTQINVDWFFKTTYIDILHTGKPYLIQPKYFVPNKTDALLQYINEVKPFQTKIKEYVETYGEAIDGALLVAHDFDSLSYTTPDEGPNEGKTILINNPEFRPNKVPRYITVESAYDSIQCGFQDKQFYVVSGNQKKTVVTNGVATLTFSVSPYYYDVLKNGSVVPPTEYNITYYPGGSFDITFEEILAVGDEIYIEEYNMSDGSAREFVFKTSPHVNEIKISTDIIGIALNEENEYDILENTVVLKKGVHFTARQHPDMLHWVIVTLNDDVLTPINGAKLYPSSGFYITHTAIEEMRLSYHAYQRQVQEYGNTKTLDLKNVKFDFMIDVNGSPISGWGYAKWGEFIWGKRPYMYVPAELQAEPIGWNLNSTQPWDTFNWDSAIFDKIENTIDYGHFVVSSGSAGRFVNIQDKNVLKDIQGKINGVEIKYSEYAEYLDNITASSVERETLIALNEVYSEEFDCSERGIVVDAKDFMFQNRDRWNTSGWGSGSWNGARTMPFVSVDINDLASVTFYPNGVTSIFYVDSLIDVVGILLDDVVVDQDDYTISQDIPRGVTIITFSQMLPASTLLEVFFDKNYNALVTYGDSIQLTYTIPYRAAISTIDINGTSLVYGAEYTVVLNATSTDIIFVSAPSTIEKIVAWHKRLFLVVEYGNGVNDTFSVLNTDVITEVYVNGTLKTEGVDYTVVQTTSMFLPQELTLDVIFAAIPSASAEIKIYYGRKDLSFNNDKTKYTLDGGKFVPTWMDDGITSELAKYKVSDNLVLTMSNNSEVPSASDFRIHVNDIQIQSWHRMSQRTSLSVDFLLGDNTITVTNPTIFPDATIVTPAVAWVNNERIVYTAKVGSQLTGVRRMTAGTTLSTINSTVYNVKTIHPIGTYVYPDQRVVNFQW